MDWTVNEGLAFLLLIEDHGWFVLGRKRTGQVVGTAGTHSYVGVGVCDAYLMLKIKLLFWY